MKLNKGFAGTLLMGTIGAFALTGCEQLDQAAADAADQARQSAGQLLEDARQARSIDDARQVADDALLEAREQAAGLLQRASEFLSTAPPQTTGGTTIEEPSESAP